MITRIIMFNLYPSLELFAGAALKRKKGTDIHSIVWKINVLKVGAKLCHTHYLIYRLSLVL